MAEAGAASAALQLTFMLMQDMGSRVFQFFVLACNCCEGFVLLICCLAS